MKPADKRRRPSLSERRQDVLDRIATQRHELGASGAILLRPLRMIDTVSARVVEFRYLAYPLLPVAAVVLLRFRPRLGLIAGLGARAWALWQVYRRVVRHAAAK